MDRVIKIEAPKLSGAQKRHVKRCESKKVFYRLSEAYRFVEKLTKNKKTQDKLGTLKHTRPYLCKVCKKIHIGHVPLNCKETFIKKNKKVY